jgi:hypothetical protein
MRSSKVTTVTSIVRSQRTPAKLWSADTDCTQSRDIDETVGVAVEMPSCARPGRAPTAPGTIVTPVSRPKSNRNTRRQSGCGSTATTVAPSFRQARTRLPTCAPMSNARSPGRRNSR